jgi:hypothetical protein
MEQNERADGLDDHNDPPRDEYDSKAIRKLAPAQQDPDFRSYANEFRRSSLCYGFATGL